MRAKPRPCGAERAINIASIFRKFELVGMVRLELTTPRTRSAYSSQLNYIPTLQLNPATPVINFLAKAKKLIISAYSSPDSQRIGKLHPD